MIKKVVDILRERESNFGTAFQDHYDTLLEDNCVTLTVFKRMVKTLNLPLTVQDHRTLRRMADPDGIGKVDLQAFTHLFETDAALQAIHLNKTLDRVATAFYIENFDLKKAFAIFDLNGDRLLNRKEFRLAMNSLGIGLRYDESDDLLKMVAPRAGGQVSYDDFVQALDA